MKDEINHNNGKPTTPQEALKTLQQHSKNTSLEETIQEIRDACPSLLQKKKQDIDSGEEVDMAKVFDKMERHERGEKI